MNFVRILLDVGYAYLYVSRQMQIYAFTLLNLRTAECYSLVCLQNTLAYRLSEFAEMLQKCFEIHLMLDAETIPEITTDTYATET